MSELKPCPCGKTPRELVIDASDSKWFQVVGDCCSEWSVEFRSGYVRSDSADAHDRAVEAWNLASRANTSAIESAVLRRVAKQVRADHPAGAYAYSNFAWAATLDEESDRIDKEKAK